MKKLLTVCAACMVASMVTAQGVESQNIVGYQTVDIKPDFNQLGVPFKVVNGTAGLSLNDITGGTVGGTSEADSDVVNIWDTSKPIPTYNQYFLYAGTLSPAYAGWNNFAFTASFDDDYPNGLPEGAAFWYQSRAAAADTLTFAGEVNSAASVDVVLAPGFNMVVNPYPTGLDLNDSGTVDLTGATGGTSEADSDIVNIWDTSKPIPTYNQYFLYAGTLSPAYAGWNNFAFTASFNDDYPDGIPSGAGFWYQSRAASDFTMTFIKPY